VTGYIKSHIKF